VNVGSLLDRGQGFLPPPQRCQTDRQVVQRSSQVGEERPGLRASELSVDACSLLDQPKTLLWSARQHRFHRHLLLLQFEQSLL